MTIRLVPINVKLFTTIGINGADASTHITTYLYPNNNTITAKIARKDGSIMERCVSEAGQEAITHYKVLEEHENYSVLSVKIRTGRTHQIRVHMAHIGHPIVGDTLYGTKSELINRQALHSYKTSFVHPITGEEIIICAELPEDMSTLLKI